MKADWIEWTLRLSFIVIITGLLNWSFYWQKNHPNGVQVQHWNIIEYPINLNNY